MEAEVDPSMPTSMLENPFLPLLYPWKHLPQETFTPVPFAQQSLVLPLPCCGTSQSTMSAFRSLSATEDQACHILVFHPAKSFTFFCI